MHALYSNDIIPAASFKQMDIVFVPPSPCLKRFVQCIWVIDKTAPSTTSVNEKLYPDAGASLTFFINPTHCKALLFHQTHVCELPWKPLNRQVSIRFRPGALKQLFGLQIDDNTNQEIDFELVLKTQRDSYRRLLENLVGKSISQQCSAIQSWLQHSVESSHASAQKWEQVLYQSMNLLVPPQHIADQHGVSRRTLERQFRNHFGFSPNKIYQFAQIRNARSLLASNKLEISQVALASGYFDQAHFTHAFRSFALETPFQYRKRKLSQIYN
ncbi:helix-turn-helix domain-containing protein [Alteromonas gracilis]|uniref:helix-turn-helix domain-containing protein n=1 Tax=Alteromonas gracilis TaxID=1479524 RepID=UPI0037367DE6